MGLLHYLSYVGGLAAFLFVTLSLASGLLWLAELIEEHSKYAKYIGMRAIYGVIALHLVLIITDHLPILPSLFSIGCHLVYLQNFSSTWPFISLSSWRFILSCLLVVADHFTWFFHFANKAQESKRYRPAHSYRSGVEPGPAFVDVAAFFAICVWFMPLFLFLSLSANDNALPSFDHSNPSSPIDGSASTTMTLNSPALAALGPQRRVVSSSLVKSVLAPLLATLPRIRRKRRDSEGLIAPRTPIRGSPLHTPVQMPAQYFPWSGNDDKPHSAHSTHSTHSTHSPNALSPNMTPSNSGMSMRVRTPPPPRRVQSEAQVGKGSNPRGLATRNGRPAVSDGLLLVEEPESIGLGMKNAGLDNGAAVPSPPRVSLGPQGNEPSAGAEVIEALKSKRKAE